MNPLKKLQSKLGADYYHSKGLTQYNRQNWEKALAYFDKAIESQPNHLKSRHLRGICYNVFGQADKALEDFRIVESLDENIDGLYYYLGVSELGCGNLSEAIEYLNKQIEVNDVASEIFFNKSMAYFRMEQYQWALDNIEIALERSPFTLDYKKFKIDILVSMEKLEEALSLLEVLKEDGVEVSSVELYKVDLLSQLERWDEALELVNQLVKDRPIDAVVFMCRGLVHKRMKNKKLARQDFEKAYQLGIPDAKAEIALLDED